MIRLETSKKTGISNFQGFEISAFALNWSKSISREFPYAIKRTNPSPFYNCHGLTFACRRTRIEKSRYIELILSDDNYQEIELRNVKAGDVVVYYSLEGDPNHSGVVVEYRDGLILPIICSKWGSLGEFIHAINHCPKIYGPEIKYYRCML